MLQRSKKYSGLCCLCWRPAVPPAPEITWVDTQKLYYTPMCPKVCFRGVLPQSRSHLGPTVNVYLNGQDLSSVAAQCLSSSRACAAQNQRFYAGFTQPRPCLSG